MKKKFISIITIFLCFSLGFNGVFASDSSEETENVKEGGYSLIEDLEYKPYSIYLNGSKLSDPKYRIARSNIGDRILYDLEEIVNVLSTELKVGIIKIGNDMSISDIKGSISNLEKLIDNTTTDYNDFKENDNILLYATLDNDIIYGITNKIGSKEFMPFSFIKHTVYNQKDNSTTELSEGILFENISMGDIESYIIKSKEGEIETNKVYFPIRFVSLLFGANIKIEKISKNETRIYIDFNNDPIYKLVYNYSDLNDENNKQLSPNQCVDVKVATKEKSVDSYLYSTNNSNLKIVEKGNTNDSLDKTFIENSNTTIICNTSTKIVKENELGFNIFIGSTAMKEFIPTKLTIEKGLITSPQFEVYHTSMGVDYKDKIINSNCPIWVRKTNLGNINNIEYVDLTKDLDSKDWKELDIFGEKKAFTDIKKIQYRYTDAQGEKHLSGIYEFNISEKEVSGDDLSINMCSKNEDYGINPSYIKSDNYVYINGSNKNPIYNREGEKLTEVTKNFTPCFTAGTYRFKSNEDNYVEVVINDEEKAKKIKKIVLVGPNGEWIGFKSPNKMDGDITEFNKEQKEYKTDGNINNEWIKVIANIEYISGISETKEFILENEKNETIIEVEDYKYIITRKVKESNTNISEFQYKKDSDYKSVVVTGDEYIINETYSDGYVAKIKLKNKNSIITTSGATKLDGDENTYELKISSPDYKFEVKAEDGTLKTYTIKLNSVSSSEEKKEGTNTDIEKIKDITVKQSDNTLTVEKDGSSDYNYVAKEEVESDKAINIKVVGTNGTNFEDPSFFPNDENGNTATIYLGKTAFKIKFKIKASVPETSSGSSDGTGEGTTDGSIGGGSSNASGVECKTDMNESTNIVGSSVTVRSEPNTTSASITSLSNTTVTVVAEATGTEVQSGNNIWKMIKLPNNQDKCGWVYSKYINTNPEPNNNEIKELYLIYDGGSSRTYFHRLKPNKGSCWKPESVRKLMAPTWEIHYGDGKIKNIAYPASFEKTTCDFDGISCVLSYASYKSFGTHHQYYIMLNGVTYCFEI